MALDQVRLSKFLSLVLRHQPESIGLVLDAQGWADVDDLIARAAAAEAVFSRAELEQVVATSDKKRFTISGDGLRIRAAQGHSVAVELGLTPREPPPVLFHGTATRFVDAIMARGLTPQSRQHVHLSLDEATALNVGRRHGQPIIFRVDAAAMHRTGMVFYVADNGVWLTDHVQPEYLTVAAAS
jgi:putative RNA 2'-phosphotransferase